MLNPWYPFQVKYIPSPQKDEKITVKNLTLRYSFWRTSKHDAKYCYDVYRLDAIILASEVVMNEIDHVAYHFPKVWEQFGILSKRIIYKRVDNFKLREYTFADTYLNADVYFKDAQRIYSTSVEDDKKNVISLSCYVQLSEIRTRI